MLALRLVVQGDASQKWTREATVVPMHSTFSFRGRMRQSTKPVSLGDATAIRVPTFPQRNTVYPELGARRTAIATMTCFVKVVLVPSLI